MLAADTAKMPISQYTVMSPSQSLIVARGWRGY
jgi:hypothetical protein